MLNNKIRRSFNKTESSIWAYQVLVLFSILYAPEFIISVFMDKFHLGLFTYLLRVIFNFTLIKLMYYIIFKCKLEEEYQWGNVDFLAYEEEYLDRLYHKDKLNYNDYDDYLEDNNRDLDKEDIYSYSLYKQKGIISSRCFVALVLISYCLGIKVLLSGAISFIISLIIPYDNVINVATSKIYRRGIVYWESEESGI